MSVWLTAPSFVFAMKCVLHASVSDFERLSNFRNLFLTTSLSSILISRTLRDPFTFGAFSLFLHFVAFSIK